MAVATRGTASNYLQRAPSPSGLADVIDLILDKGLVIDAYVRVAVIGIEVITIDARIVIASVDTYLRFAEAVNRLDLGQSSDEGLPQLVEDMTSDGAQSKTKGVLEGAKESLFGSSDEDEDEDSDEKKNGGGSSGSRSRSRSSSGSGSRSRSCQRSSSSSSRGR
jgi:hypothetical protein